MANLVRAVPASVWADCTTLDRATCLAGVARQPKARLRNDSMVPTVFGQVALSVESTVKWAYRRLTETRYTIGHIAPADVDCDHGH